MQHVEIIGYKKAPVLIKKKKEKFHNESGSNSRIFQGENAVDKLTTANNYVIKASSVNSVIEF